MTSNILSFLFEKKGFHWPADHVAGKVRREQVAEIEVVVPVMRAGD